MVYETFYVVLLVVALVLIVYCNKAVSYEVEWNLTAAYEGDADAQYALGCAYEKGEGITADKTQAIAWYRKAAGQGKIEALSALKRLEVCRSYDYNEVIS